MSVCMIDDFSNDWNFRSVDCDFITCFLVILLHWTCRCLRRIYSIRDYADIQLGSVKFEYWLNLILPACEIDEAKVSKQFVLANLACSYDNNVCN